MKTCDQVKTRRFLVVCSVSGYFFTEKILGALLVNKA